MASSKNAKSDVSAQIKANGKAGFVVMIPSQEGKSGKEGQWVLRLPSLQALEAMSPDLAAFLTTMDPEEVVTLDCQELVDGLGNKPVIGFRPGRLTDEEVVNFICPEGSPSTESREWDLEFTTAPAGDKSDGQARGTSTDLISPSDDAYREQISFKSATPYIVSGAVGVIVGVLAGLGISQFKDSKSEK